MLKKLFTLLLILTIFMSQTQPTYALNLPTEPDVSAPSYIIMDAKTGNVLYGRNIDEKVYPASTTKIMTILLALKYGNMNQTLTTSEFDVFSLEYGASNIALQPDENIPMKDALYAASIVSANDACNTIASAIGGTYENFIDMMNKEAKEAGAKNTNFVNPHGLHDDNHYTTPYDLAMIMRYGVQIEGYTDILSADEYTIPATNKFEEREMYTHNSLIFNESTYYVEGIQASKTGYTEQANLTLISYAKRGDVELIVGAFGLPDKVANFQTSKELFEYGFEHYTAYPTLEISIPISEATLPKGYHFKAKHFYASDVPETITAYKDVSEYPITSEITLNPIQKDTKQGDIIGRLEYKQNNEIISTTNVYLNTDIYKFDILDLILTILGILLVIIVIIVMSLFILRAYIRRKRRKLRAKKRYHY